MTTQYNVETGELVTLNDAPEPTVVACMARAMEIVRSVGKTGHNASQDYNFRGIDAVVNAAGPAFREVGIVPMPRCSSMEREAIEVGRNRTQMALVSVRVTYRFYGPAGDYIEAEDVPGEAMDSGDKAVSKAMSVAYRIALLQALCIPTSEPDPDEHSYERSPKQEQPTPAGITSDEAGERLRGHLDGKVSGDVAEHGRAVWRLAKPKVADDGLIYPTELARLLSVADELLADLEAMKGEPEQPELVES